MDQKKDQSRPVASIPALRQQFPALHQQAHGQPLVYLDSAATTQKPQVVIEQLARYYRCDNANVHRGAHFLSARATGAFEQAREQVRVFINAASTEEIIWTRGATEAINLVAQSWGRQQLQAGDEILLTMMEHHANIVPWQLLARQTGAVIRVIGLTPAGELDLNQLRQRLSARTRLLALTHIANATGTINPVYRIIREARAGGVRILIDGSQAIAHQPVDVRQLDCDFYVFSGHKAMGPTGIGVLYGRKALLQAMPPWQGGGEMIHRVSFQETTFNNLPFKFEAGTPHIAGAIGLGAALSFLQGLDRQSIIAHEQALRQRLETGLNSISGLDIIGQAQDKAAISSFVSRQMHHQDLSLLLDRHGIAVRAGHHCAMPLMEHLGLAGTVRASLSFYNNEADIDALLNALETIHQPRTYPAPAPVADQSDDPFAAVPYGQRIDQKTVHQQLMAAAGWQARYRQIMQLGQALPRLPDHWKTETARLSGCESSVWLHHDYNPATRILRFAADSDARIIRGLIALVLVAVNGQTPTQIQMTPVVEWFAQLELDSHLSPSRGNGLKAIIGTITAVARRYG